MTNIPATNRVEGSASIYLTEYTPHTIIRMGLIYSGSLDVEQLFHNKSIRKRFKLRKSTNTWNATANAKKPQNRQLA